ncbi:NTP transferase domain-containing protein [Arthrobacter sp. KBS0703]|uniref:molybdenum cofactor guanylyltransferase n=1 Tax=Arthrobacter sp. KBS0703 TaxID=1955698 RepID=UPI0028C3CAFD|nr:NTP transferase domain-containing protein [Arthrobacter sp. KBS0703]
MDFDAIVLAGGRSSRLGGTPKSALMYDGATLLERSIAAAGGARRIVVVGPEPADLPAGILSCREDPPFAGPAAAIAAGLAGLRRARAADEDDAALVLVLACDMPRAADAVGALRGRCCRRGRQRLGIVPGRPSAAAGRFLPHSCATTRRRRRRGRRESDARVSFRSPC